MAPIDTSAAARATAAPDAAAAARAGITLHAIDDDAGALLLVASRWALTCKLHSLDEAEAWLNRVAGRAA
jgi:predicted ATPase